MEFAIWTYPWDLLDEGVESAAKGLMDRGIDEINLATNYHTVQGFLPHNPERRTFFAHASAYFQPGNRYEDLSPVPNERMDDVCWLTMIADRLPDGLGLNSWTIGCHNSRLGMQHPDCTLTSPHGDDLVFGLCPSNPRVQQYLVDLVADLDGRNLFDRIELESFDYFHGSGFGWHHQKFHTDVGDLGEFLFGICFCEYCRERAADAGVDVERARKRCKETVDDLATGRLSTGIDPAAWVRTHPAVDDYLAIRTETLAEVFAEIRAVTDAEIGYYPLLSPERAWMHGVDFDQLAEYVDYFVAIAYESTPADARTTIQTADALTPDIPLHAGVLPGYPHIQDGASAREVINTTIDAGAERISVYNYGLLPDRNLDWVGAVAAEHE